MNDTLRHMLIFVVITGTGTALIFLNLPLLFILALEAIVGFLLLVLLSPGFGAELRSSVPDMLKISFIRRDRGKRPLFKITDQKRTGQKKPEPPFVIEREEKTPFSVRPLVSSFRDLFSRMTTRKKSVSKTPDETGRIPDAKAGENADISALALAGELSEGPGSLPGRGGGATARGRDAAPVEDPFLSLSSDELETGLLDTFEEPEQKEEPATIPESPVPLPESHPIMDAMSGLSIGESDIPLPPQEVPMEHGENTNAKEPEADDYYGFEGTETIDQNFGDFDDAGTGHMEPDEDIAREGTGPGTQVQPAPLEPIEQVPETPGPVPAPGPGSPAIQSAAATPSSDKTSAQQTDMAIFTAPVSADDEMVRSLASDVKTAKKTRDAGLLRELKGFNAPAEDIEGELNEIFSELNAAADKKTKIKP
ncbi:MAG: hypothetical protein OS112_06470 [Methanoregula sp.]|nr:MAG: hypothetical protein OS112_06470 [Methanoregula sp.]